MIDLESMVKSLRLALLKRLFNDSNVTWKTYLLHLLDPVKQFSAMAGLCHSVPSHLKEIGPDRLTISPSLVIGKKNFDIKDKKSKDYYLLLVSKKAQPPNITSAN